MWLAVTWMGNYAWDKSLLGRRTDKGFPAAGG
jgi:hypothetical protein